MPTPTDFANDVEARRSTSGYAILFNGPIAWRNCRQPIVALSPTEAEYVSGCELVKDLLPIRNLMLEIRAIPKTFTTIFIDNISAVKMSANLVSRQRTKHIDVRSRWISEHVATGEILVKHIPGENQIADILTKPLPKQRFITLRNLLMNIPVLLPILAVSTAETGLAFSFSKVEPSYYRPTQISYLTNTISREITILFPNYCKLYFENLLIDPAINDKLIKDCYIWFNQSTKQQIHTCKPGNLPTGKLNSTVWRSKRFITLFMLGYYVNTGGTIYAIVKAENNSKNIQILQEAINDNRKTLRQVYLQLNKTRFMR